MSKTTSIKGLIYETQAGRVVDYGLGNLYKSSKSSSLQTCIISDSSICPPLYDKSEFERNIDYKATVISIEKTGIRVQVCGEIGYIYFYNLVRYWGCMQCLKKNYKPGTRIDVCFKELKENYRYFTEKGGDTVPFSSFTYLEGDEVDMHIGPADDKRLLLWFNGTPMDVKSENDTIFKKRILSGVYYPGYPVKAKVISVNDSIPGKRYYSFSVIHEHIDYGIKTGEQILPIIEEYGIKYVNINSEKGICCTRILDNEIPAGFPLVNNGKFQARIRITDFDEYGEPIIQFGSFMKELYKRHEGESFDIELVKFNDAKSPYRIWMGPDGLFGTVAKSLLDMMGDLSCELEGHIIDGEIHVTKRGCDILHIKAGNLEKASITSRTPSCWKAAIGERPVLIFNCANVHESSETLEVKVLYVDNANGLIICIPANTSYGQTQNLGIGATVSMQILEKTASHIVLGNGGYIGVMEIKDWDWSNGKTLQESDINSLYFDTLIKDTTEEGVLVLDRHELSENPWEKFEQMKEQPVQMTIKDMSNLHITIQVNGIISTMRWGNFCPYNVNYAKYLFEKGDTVTLILKDVDTQRRKLYLRYRPEDAVDTEVTFDTNAEYTAEVIKVIPAGILISVQGIYGIIVSRKLISDRQYIPGELINVRFVRHSLYGQAHNFEFSHITIVDTTQIYKYGNVILSAKVEGIDEHRISFVHNGVRLYCNTSLAKYFSAERNKDFAKNIIKGQTFNLRVTDEQNMVSVPESMPDYSSLVSGSTFNARIDEILDDGYILYFDELNDSFKVPFMGFCDWGPSHYETRNQGDIVNVTLTEYSYASNTPVFSMISGQENPWKNLRKGDTVIVRGLGSKFRKKDFYVDVNGVPVELSIDAICCILGMPWIDRTLDYSSIQKLEGDREFEMDIISINKKDFTIELMPHINEIPTTVRKAQVCHNRKGSDCVWVRCEKNIIGRIDRSEFPEGYEFKQMIEQAVCTSFNYTKGYANLSVKALFAVQETETSIPMTDTILQGVVVTEGMELHEQMIVRGVLKNVDKRKERIFINVGPYLGIITFTDISNMFCAVPERVFENGKEYDFCIKQIDHARNNLLYLSRREFSPMPPAKVKIGMHVKGKVCRYCSLTEKIVVEIVEFNNAEAVIYAADLVGCKLRNKTRYPQIGFELTAYVKEIHRGKSGAISQIILNRGI